jgi:TatA/E family protein of Tat protein translocase
MTQLTLAGVFNEWVWLLLIGFLALMVFGRRLPEMGKSLGKGIVEFKKGLAGTDDEGKQASAPGDTDATGKPRAIESNASQAALPAASIDAKAAEELRETREQLRQLADELKATRSQILDLQQKPKSN